MIILGYFFFLIFLFLLSKTYEYALGTHQKRLAEALLMSTHIICFYGEVEKSILYNP